MNKPTSFQKYLLEQSRSLGSFDVAKRVSKLPKVTLQPKQTPFRSGEGEEPVEPKPHTQLEINEYWGDDGVMPRPDFQSEYDQLEDNNGQEIVIVWVIDNYFQGWTPDGMWQDIMHNLFNFLRDIPDNPETWTDYFNQFLENLPSYYDMFDNEIDLSEHMHHMVDILEDIIENGLSEYGMEGNPDIWNELSMTQRYLILQQLKALYNFFYNYEEQQTG